MRSKQAKKNLGATISILLCLLLFLTNCSVAPTSTPEIPSTPAHTATVEPSATPTPEPTPKVEPKTELTYKIDAKLDYLGRYMLVNQTILMPPLDIQPPNITLLVEAAQYTNGYAVRNLSFNGTPITEYELGINRLSFIPENFDHLSNKNEISLEYELYLPAIPQSNYIKSQPYGFTERQMNIVDWYAALPPQDDNGDWIVHDVYIVGETVVLRIAAVDIHLVITDFDKPLIIASSVEPRIQNNDYYFETKANRSFAISISTDYVVAEGQAGLIRVKSYAFPLFAEQNKAVLDYTIKALEFYEKQFGPLDRESLSVVQADFLDGMEFDGLYYLSKGFYDLDPTPTGYLAMIAVHETSHQWWFAEVGNDQSLEPWLDEALATFSEYLFYQSVYPETLNWWWQSRINFYNPKGFINLPVSFYADYMDYRNSVYLNGARFFYDLREYIGHQEFDELLSSYYESNKGKIATARDFMEAFRKSPKYPFETLMRQYTK